MPRSHPLDLSKIWMFSACSASQLRTVRKAIEEVIVPAGRVLCEEGTLGRHLPVETPILSEQGRDYIILQLKMYASSQRRNDVYARMRTIAAKLTPGEIDGLATYYRAGFR